MNNIVIIGGGIAGYTAALNLASEDHKVTLVEKDLLGGTCLNKGCIPTKILLNLSKFHKDFDFIQKEKNQKIQYLRSAITYLISAKKIKYYTSEAKILKNNCVLLKQSDKKINYDVLILAIGSQPVIPKSLIKADALTSDEILDLKEIPRRIIIVGGGNIGVEMAHIFNNLGAKVYIIEKEDSILPSINQSASNILTDEMRQKGIEIFTGTVVEDCSNHKAILDNRKVLEFGKIFVCTGRIGSVIESEVDIEYENNFIKTDNYFKTSQKDIYAIGDCINGPLLAHRAEYDAMVLTHNLLYNSRENRNYRKIPNCIFSTPSIAYLGIDDKLSKVRVEFKSIGKSYCDDSTKGFLEIYLDGDKRICGFLVVNNNAPEILAALTPIVYEQMSCEKVLKMVWSHPTSAEIIKEAVKKALR